QRQDRYHLRADDVDRTAAGGTLQRTEKCATEIAHVRELPRLPSVAANAQRLAVDRSGYEDREHRVRAHARAVGGSEPQGDGRHVLETIVRERHLLAGELGDVVGMVGVARV